MAKSATTTPAQRRKIQWGKNLAQAIKARDLTVRRFQRVLADDGADVSVQAIYLWLSGDSAPTSEKQDAIAKVLAVPVEEIFPDDGEAA